jgi:ribosomal protein S18 acetylase RimI-like enzyme
MSLKFHEATPSSTVVCADAVAIQKEYGSYMYDVLKLTEAKELFYKSLQSFPSPYFDRPSGCYFVAYNKDNEAVGAVGIREWKEEASCEIKRIFVRPDHRRSGYGDFLIAFIIEEAVRMGYKTIYLDSDKMMTAAIKLYLKHGFVEIDSYYPNENPGAIYFKKEI